MMNDYENTTTAATTLYTFWNTMIVILRFSPMTDEPARLNKLRIICVPIVLRSCDFFRRPLVIGPYLYCRSNRPRPRAAITLGNRYQLPIMENNMLPKDFNSTNIGIRLIPLKSSSTRPGDPIGALSFPLIVIFSISSKLNQTYTSHTDDLLILIPHTPYLARAPSPTFALHPPLILPHVLITCAF